MKAVKVRIASRVKAAVFLSFLSAMPVLAVKYVAVVESDIEAASGASAALNSAEVREITAEIRRQATENLPPERYSVMTTETVQSMGGAVLDECSEENCVVTLGSKIGADYIVRATISKFQTRFTLKVELYETDGGTLVAMSDPVRSENIEDLLDKATTASANMYKKFLNAQSVILAHPTASDGSAVPEPKINTGIDRKPQAVKPRTLIAVGLDAIGTAFLAYGLYQNSVVKDCVDDNLYKNRAEQNEAKKAAGARNVGYTIGSALLIAGISVHIFF
ncbi:hypothetical protein R80B4_00446 [Fibrobacteres bacterium R8-0-B4]